MPHPDIITAAQNLLDAIELCRDDPEASWSHTTEQTIAPAENALHQALRLAR